MPVTAPGFELPLKRAKKRQIRKVGARIGLPVGKIKRVRIGPLKLGKLKSGEWRYLTDFEVKKLMEYTKIKKKPPLNSQGFFNYALFLQIIRKQIRSKLLLFFARALISLSFSSGLIAFVQSWRSCFRI